MKKHTKIVATISDKRCSVEFIKQLYEKGLNVIRLNTAHLDHQGALKIISNAREVSEKIAILIDTKGPDIRTTITKKDFEVSEGDKITIKANPESYSSRQAINVSYDGFVNDMPLGCKILIDDGELEFEIIEKNEDNLVCEVKNDGIVKSRKSINVPGVHINLPSLNEKDIGFIDFAIENSVTFIAHSFVRNKEDVIAIQEILDKKNSPIKLIAKIENQQGVDNIDEILEKAYGIMVARGDLGIEISAEKIPGIQKLLVRKANCKKKPVIIATQMLHSMIENPRPTRAEVNDVANAIYHETDAIMLSGETAYGNYPVEAVETMSKIAKEVEMSVEVRDNTQIIAVDNQTAIYLARAAVYAELQLPLKAIVLDTLTGRTARYVAAFRGKNNVNAICYHKHVMRELALSYGIYADYMPPRRSTDNFKRDAINILLEKGVFKPDDIIAIIGGSFGPRNGASFLEINTVGNLQDMKEYDDRL